MKLHLSLLLAVGLGATALACTRATEDAGKSEAAQSQGDPIDPRVVLPGQELARCWFQAQTESSDLFDLVCKHTATAGYPYKPGDIHVLPMAMANDWFLGGSGSSSSIGEGEGLQVPARGIKRADFPLRIRVNADIFSFNDANRNEAPITSYGEYTTDTRLLAPATEANPIIVKQPFDLWPIRIVNLASVGYELKIPAYKFSLGAAKLRGLSTDRYNGTSESEAEIRSLMSFNGTKTAYMPVPIEGKIAATIAPRQAGAGVSGAATEVVFDGPGMFLWEDSGLRRATPEEIAQLAPELPAN